MLADAAIGPASGLAVAPARCSFEAPRPDFSSGIPNRGDAFFDLRAGCGIWLAPARDAADLCPFWFVGAIGAMDGRRPDGAAVAPVSATLGHVSVLP